MSKNTRFLALGVIALAGGFLIGLVVGRHLGTNPLTAVLSFVLGFAWGWLCMRAV